MNGDRENVRVRETNLGNVVADSLYQYGQTGFSHPTDIAVTNGGGLRETIAKDKPITKGNVIAVLPFGNTISQIQVTGQQVLDMFEKSLGSILQVDKAGKTVLDENGQPLLEPSGGFLQVSGVKVYYDTNLPSGKRILAVQVKNRTTGLYDRLDLAKIYYLTTNDFLAAGGDGYTMLGGAREEGPSMDAAFEDYLKTADLNAYEKINPNSRTISVDSKTFKLEEEKQKETPVGEIGKVTPKEEKTLQPQVNTGKLTYQVASQYMDKPLKTEENAVKPLNADKPIDKPAGGVNPTLNSDDKTQVSEKLLPNTGSEQSIFMTVLGMFLGVTALWTSRKQEK